MRIWIQSPLATLLPKPEQQCGGLVIKDDVIEKVLAPGQPAEGDIDQIFDASGLVLLSGLVNTHHHYNQTLTRAFTAALDKELFAWLKSLYPVWAGLTPEMIFYASRLASAELLLSGCTNSADHHYIFPTAALNALDIQAEAVAGMRWPHCCYVEHTGRNM